MAKTILFILSLMMTMTAMVQNKFGISYHINAFIDSIGLKYFSMYIFDYSAPVSMRIAMWSLTLTVATSRLRVTTLR